MYPNPYEASEPNLAPKCFESHVFARQNLPNQQVNQSALDPLRLDIEIEDRLGEFALDVPSGEYRFTPKQSGYYLIVMHVTWALKNNAAECNIEIRRNALVIACHYGYLLNAFPYTEEASTIYYLDTTNYVTFYVYQNAAPWRATLALLRATYITIKRVL